MVSQVPSVSSEAMSAWLRLSAALEETGRRVPCQVSDPDLWFSSERADVELAVACCNSCPIQELCRAYAIAADERSGIWGGEVFEPRSRTRMGSHLAGSAD